jgi:hypothetical protein
VIGAEYVALAVIASGVAIVLDRRAGNESGNALGRLLDVANPTSVTCVLLLAVGVVLILGHGRGLYLLVPALFAVLVGCVINAWLILVRLSDSGHTVSPGPACGNVTRATTRLHGRQPRPAVAWASVPK